MASQFSSAQWPQTSVALKGNLSVNGYPAGPKDSYFTLGGIIDTAAAANATLTVAPFGVMVSSLAGTPDLWAQGLPGGHLPRGVLIVDQSIMYNEPMKANGYAVGLPATIMTRGEFRLSSWTANGLSNLTTPYINAVPVINVASGYIEFAPSGTTTAPNGFAIPKDAAGNNILRIVDLDPLLGSTSVGGVLMYVQAY